MHYEYKNTAKTSLWEEDGKYYETTQMSSFLDRSTGLARLVVKPDYVLTTLWESPIKIDKPMSTQKNDYNTMGLKFEPKTMSDFSAGVLTKSKRHGFCYGSEEYHKINDLFTVENKRMVSIFDQHGRGKFRDERQTQSSKNMEQSLIRKKIKANLTIPIAK